MAYEGMTYEVILHRMMDRVTTIYPNIDTREGSILFNALAPAAIELAIMYTELDNAINESFVNTASREYLLIGCEQMGMDTSVFDATHGVFRGEFDAEIDIGSRWNFDSYNYTVTEYLGVEENLYVYKLQCETSGSAPNVYSGILTPINYIPANLGYAVITGCLIEGENEATDDEIRNAYSEFINSASIDGNVNQYKKWCNEYDGIGNSKILPLWNGANTVKVSILSESNTKASDELIQEFQEYLDPNTTGMGDGVAPIGAFVTVGTATTKTINVSAEVAVQEDYDSETVMSMMSETLSVYFRDISYVKSTVSYMSVGAVLSDVDGVEFINNLRVNNSTANIPIDAEEVPVLGTTTWTVVTE
jgi:uncharacterized phage protein gp47/JayE